mmetsp:Transcript_22265/g.62476  ORF Transcript_22265/g.62476 Transcript_22265/m.62476 type:complete len:616 (+) Transcript_22265:114-1961(+)
MADAATTSPADEGQETPADPPAAAAAAEEDAAGAAGADPDEKEGGSPEKEGGAPLAYEEIEACNLQEMAKDKFQSRLLQQSLLRGGAEVVQLIFKKAEPFFMDLVRDQYGNYLSQKILEVSSAEQFDGLFSLLQLHLKDLAQDVHGTRAVQKIVEQAIARGKVAELLEALPGDLVEKLARSVTGFHVIVKLLESLPTTEAEDLLERLCGTPEKALALGKDQWGCCVLKKCVDRADGATRQKIMDAIADSTPALVQDPFGNYVVQHLILAGHARPNPNVTRIIDALRGQMFELSLQKFSSNVLEKCLVNSSDKDRNKIINEILNPPNCLPSEAVRMLLFHQYGNYVYQQALEVAKDPQFSLLVEHSKQSIQDIVRSAQPPQPPQQQPADAPQPAGNLAPEHARRLAMKLVKKYPPLSEGLDIDSSIAGASSWGQYYDPYAVTYGTEGYGAAWAAGGPASAPAVYGYPFPSWDPSFGAAYQPLAYPPAGGKGAGRKGGAKGGGGGRAWSHSNKADGGKDRGGHRGKQQASCPPGVELGGLPLETMGGPAAAIGGDGGNQSVRIPRIVGFWPNYTITYDDVPAAGGAGSGAGKGGRSKHKAKGKAAAKKGGGAAPAEF